MGPRKEQSLDRAARCNWLPLVIPFSSSSREELRQLLERLRKKVRTRAAILIQCVVRGFLVRRQWPQYKYSLWQWSGYLQKKLKKAIDLAYTLAYTTLVYVQLCSHAQLDYVVHTL